METPDNGEIRRLQPEGVKQGDTYILIQPVVHTEWVATKNKIGEDEADPAKAPANMRFKSLQAAMQSDFLMKMANKMDLGYRARLAPTGGRPDVATSFDEETLIKVYSAFQKLEVDRKTAIAVVQEMQNEGILFRERAVTIQHRADDGIEPGDTPVQPDDPESDDIVDESGKH